MKKNHSHPGSGHQPLRQSVEIAMQSYFTSLDGETPTMVYTMVIQEVESALLKSMMEYTGHNQSQCAEYLGLSRGTLRKKLKVHGLI